MQGSRKRIQGQKRRKWKNYILPSLIVLLLVIITYLSFTMNNNKQAASDKKEDIPTPTITNTVDSEIEGIQIVSEQSKSETSPYAIEYPQSESEAFNEAVITYITSLKEDYLADIKQPKNKNTELKAELTIKLDMISHHTGNYSFLLTSSTLSNNENPKNAVRAFHLNVENGEILTIETIADHNEENLTALATTIKEQLLTNKKFKELIDQDKLEEKLSAQWKNFNNFSLTDTEITFYFEPHSFTSQTVEVPTVTLPIETINDLVAEPFKVKTETPASEEKIVALTFDDGPHPTITQEILATLEKYNAKATFFMLGNRVDKSPEIVKEIADAGHELGNHSWSHPDLSRQSAERIKNEIENTSIVIERATGQNPTVFRPPYGSFNDTVRNETNLPIILWDVDTLDWKHLNPAQTLSIVKTYTRSGSNILMHDIHQSTANALDSILAFLQSEGYKFVTVSELESNLTK